MKLLLALRICYHWFQAHHYDRIANGMHYDAAPDSKFMQAVRMFDYHRRKENELKRRRKA